MAEYDDPTDEENLQPAPGEMAPGLQQFVDAFTDPAAKEWASTEVAPRLNDAFQKRDIAQANSAAGDNFVNNLDGFKQGLANFAAGDPTMTTTAMDLVSPTLKYLLGSVPGADIHHDELNGHFEQEIAAAGVASAAKQNFAHARMMLDNERIRNALGVLVEPLSNFAEDAQQARVKDEDAKKARDTENSELMAGAKAADYIGALYDPRNGMLRFPEGWNLALKTDQAVPPEDKPYIAAAYDKLYTQGDAPQTDPLLLMNLAFRVQSGRAPSVPDIIKLITSGDIKAGDAMYMMGGAGKPSLATRNEFSSMSSALELGHKMLVTEANGKAGDVQFTSWVNDWLMKNLRDKGPSILNLVDASGAATPALTVLNKSLHDFAPSGKDIADADVTAATAATVASRSRPAIDKFFTNEGREELKIGLPPKPKEPTPIHLLSGYEVTPDGGGVRPIKEQTNPNRAPFYGLSRLDSQDIINPQGTDRDVHGNLLQEMATDTGIKALTASDINQSFTGPKPAGLPELSPKTQKAILEGRTTEAGVPAKPRAELRQRARPPRLGRRR